MSCVSKSSTLAFDNGAALVFSTKDKFGAIILTVLFSFLGLENPGNSHCCTGCFGNKGKKNLSWRVIEFNEKSLRLTNVARM